MDTKVITKRVKLHCKMLGRGTHVRIVPWLNLNGKWLEELGFKVGDHLRISMREKLLIIEPIEGEEKEMEGYKTQLKEVKQTLKKLVS